MHTRVDASIHNLSVAKLYFNSHILSLCFFNNNAQCSDPYINIVVEGANHCSLDTDGDGIPDYQVFTKL